MAKPTSLSGVDRKLRLRDAVDALVAVRLSDVRRFEAPLVSSKDVDAVHDMRVASRRLRAALKLVHAPEDLDGQVKALQDALGSVRDLHVQREWLDRTAAAAAHRDEKVALRLLRRELDGALPKRERRLDGALRAWRDRTAPSVIPVAAANAPAGRLGGDGVRRTLRRRLRALGDAIEAYAHSSTPLTAHRFRIEVKKLRYLADLLQGAWPVPIRKLQRALGGLQSMLGDLHDEDVRLASLIAAARIHRDAPGLSKVIIGERMARARLESRAAAQAAEWRASHRVRDLRRLFRKTAR